MKSAPGIRPTALVVLAFTGLAFAQGGEPLTNDDIVKMVQAQLSPGIIATTIESAKSVKFDLSSAALIALKSAGVSDRLIETMQAKARAAGEQPAAAPEKSDRLATSNDREFILRNFKTMLVDASKASLFGSDQMESALHEHKKFAALNITVVDDRAVADVILEVGYTFAWDYPFSLKHQNTSVVLVSGKGTGPFSGPRGATSVASELVKLLTPYRTAPPPKAPKK